MCEIMMETNLRIRLTIENDGNMLWGSVWLGQKLIVETATSKAGLELSILKILYDFHGIEPDEVEFDVLFIGQ